MFAYSLYYLICSDPEKNTLSQKQKLCSVVKRKGKNEQYCHKISKVITDFVFFRFTSSNPSFKQLLGAGICRWFSEKEFTCWKFAPGCVGAMELLSGSIFKISAIKGRKKWKRRKEAGPTTRHLGCKHFNGWRHCWGLVSGLGTMWLPSLSVIWPETRLSRMLGFPQGDISLSALCLCCYIAREDLIRTLGPFCSDLQSEDSGSKDFGWRMHTTTLFV